jgi:hypothetical protein
MQDATVLDVRPSADLDRLGVPSDDRIEPKAGIFPDCHVTENVHARGDKDGRMDQFGPKGEDSTHSELPRRHRRSDLHDKYGKIA